MPARYCRMMPVCRKHLAPLHYNRGASWNLVADAPAGRLPDALFYAARGVGPPRDFFCPRPVCQRSARCRDCSTPKALDRIDNDHPRTDPCRMIGYRYSTLPYAGGATMLGQTLKKRSVGRVRCPLLCQIERESPAPWRAGRISQDLSDNALLCGRHPDQLHADCP